MKRIFLILILIFCTGCTEYLHKPDEITIEVHTFKSDFGQNVPTTGVTVGATWHREKGK